MTLPGERYIDIRRHLPLEIMDLALRMAVRLRAVFLSFFEGWEKRFS